MNLTVIKCCCSSLVTAALCAWAWHAVNSEANPAPFAGQDEIAAFGDPARNGLMAARGTMLLKGGSYAVRGLEEDVFDENTKRVPYEIYRDDDFGTLAYVTETGDIATLPYRKNFQIRTLGVGDGGFEVVRFSQATGASWRLINEQWVAIRETDAGLPQPGDYQIEISDIGGAAVIFRIEQGSGATWLLNDTDWSSIPETGADFKR